MDIKAWVTLLRPVNCILAMVAAWIGALCVCISFPWEAMVVVFLFTGAGNVLNDYCDREIDRINHPERPIPSGRIKAEHALIVSSALFSLGLLTSLFINLYCIMVAILALGLLYSYEKVLKRRGFVGNFTISALVAFVFIFGGFSVLVRIKDIILPLVLGVLAMLANLSREVVKDVQDLRGDWSRESLPRRIGVRNANLVVSCLLLLAIFISPLPYLLGFRWVYLLAISCADIGFIYSLLRLDDAKKASKWIKIGMIVALGAFAIGVVA